VACRARAVKIPTFDRDPETGETRRLHAFVLEPREPAPESQRRALVRAFYGGDNRYDVYDQILCAAGLTVISAAVRGSAGFGKIFAGLNDRDLGGNEIVDLFQIARWTESEFGFPAARIGVYGRSHGGYATMRALTFPAETNGGGEPYRFGFGLAEAGFSDILAFHEHTNIPDWVVLESGDPAVPADKARMAERSPINHVERLAVPLFLLHGANDWRVPVDGSREFAHKAETLGKSVTYVEVEGQGHHVEGLERIVAAWQSRLDFLMGLPGDTPPG
jgi:dipeptidyl aminopeptidase/acylaminoacyl peptidase